MVHQDVEVSQKDLFDVTVESMVRQHQGNPLCAVSYYVGVLDGITPTDTRHPLQVAFEKGGRVSALFKKGTHLMCLLLEIALQTAQTSDSQELTVGNALLAV